MKSTDISIFRVVYDTEEFLYRTPIKFGGVALDRVTLLNAAVEVESRQGKRAIGKGSMPMGNVWAFPSSTLSYQQTLDALLQVADRVAGIYTESRLTGHPVEITCLLESQFFAVADQLASQLKLGQPIPRLATLVAASPFDAALHDAYGKLHGVNVYHAYGTDFIEGDLSRFLGDAFRGVYFEDHLSRSPVDSLPLYHLVGALDPVTPADVITPVSDGLPETLVEWIAADGLTHLKVKMAGNDLDWDVERLLHVESAARQAQAVRAVREWHYSLDFNEKCPHVDYLLQFIARIKFSAPEAYSRIAYIEQPTARDLAANRQNAMHAVSSQIPVVIDESLLDLESLMLAREMGYTGAALKACKGQTQSILSACAARHLKMFLCVQDLTCPGASLIQSAGIAAHVKGVSAIEANSRQYCPNANADWARRFPGIFEIKKGVMHTGQLTGLGLGAYPNLG